MVMQIPTRSQVLNVDQRPKTNTVIFSTDTNLTFRSKTSSTPAKLRGTRRPSCPSSRPCCPSGSAGPWLTSRTRSGRSWRRRRRLTRPRAPLASTASSLPSSSPSLRRPFAGRCCASSGVRRRRNGTDRNTASTKRDGRKDGSKIKQVT